MKFVFLSFRPSFPPTDFDTAAAAATAASLTVPASGREKMCGYETLKSFEEPWDKQEGSRQIVPG